MPRGVWGLRIWAVKNSTVRSAACGPARRIVAGRPSICQPPDTTSAAGAADTGTRASGGGAKASGASGGVGRVGSVPEWSCHGQIVT